MAWTCSGQTNDELIDNLVHANLITRPSIAHALKKIDRANYVDREEVGEPGCYRDCPQPIGFGVTISAPHIHVAALENLVDHIVGSPPSQDAPPPSETGQGSLKGLPIQARRRRRVVLDVGCGSGYLTAAIHHLLRSTPSAEPDTDRTSESTEANHNLVVGIDHLPELTNLSMVNMTRDGLRSKWAKGSGRASLMDVEGDGDEGEIVLVTGDGRQGCPAYAPYDAIHVGAAAPELPQALVDQLNSPGRMFIPIGTHTQDIWQIDKDAQGTVSRKKLFGVRYVPLTDSSAQWSED